MSHRARAGLLLVLGLGACRPFTPPDSPAADVPRVGGAQISSQGTVLSVERPRPEDTQSFVHLVIVPADKKPIRLVLGPGWYLDREGIRFEPNENVRFEGRAAPGTGEEPSVEVRRIERGDRTYRLRDEQNRPAWTVKP